MKEKIKKTPISKIEEEFVEHIINQIFIFTDDKNKEAMELSLLISILMIAHGIKHDQPKDIVVEMLDSMCKELKRRILYQYDQIVKKHNKNPQECSCNT